MTVEKREPGEDAAADRSRLYVAVVIVETIVVAALWAFGRYFGS